MGSRNSRKRTVPGWVGRRFVVFGFTAPFLLLCFITTPVILPPLRSPCNLRAGGIHPVYREWGDPRDGRVWLVQVFYGTSEDAFGRPRAVPRMITYRRP